MNQHKRLAKLIGSGRQFYRTFLAPSNRFRPLFHFNRLREQNATTVCAYIHHDGNCDDVFTYVDFYYCGGGAKAKPAAWIAFVRLTRTLVHHVKRLTSVVGQEKLRFLRIFKVLEGRPFASAKGFDLSLARGFIRKILRENIEAKVSLAQ